MLPLVNLTTGKCRRSSRRDLWQREIRSRIPIMIWNFLDGSVTEPLNFARVVYCVDVEAGSFPARPPRRQPPLLAAQIILVLLVNSISLVMPLRKNFIHAHLPRIE